MNRQEELEGMSDFEINKLVAGSSFYCEDYDGLSPNSNILINEGLDLVDYCNWPENIMPLAIENNISLLLDNTDSPEATTDPYQSIDPDGTPFINSYGENPYRAICIVLILMKEDEPNKHINQLNKL